jgi:hypothetical protein
LLKLIVYFGSWFQQSIGVWFFDLGPVVAQYILENIHGNGKLLTYGVWEAKRKMGRG